MKKLILSFTIPIITVIFAIPSFAQKKSIPELNKIPGAERLNVIFILSDDHRHDFMGFTGKIPWLRTPGFDRLAREGAWFRNAFVTSALCSPSRATILTGQYSHEHTIVDNTAPEPADLIYFPQYLHRAGYQTAFLGKWHMGEEDDRTRKGFDHWESFKGQGVYFNPELHINGKKVIYGDSTYITDLLTHHAIEWMRARNKKQPFFLYLSHKAVHAEFAPASRHRGMYTGKKYPLPSTFYQTVSDEYKSLHWPEWVKQQRYSWHGVDYMYHGHHDIHEMVQRYCETLMAVDESIITILDYLNQDEAGKNTIVIYIGDNGFSWGEHGLIDKRHFYEESVKVPLMIYSPGYFRGGITINEMVQNIDVAPTILACAGLMKPEYMSGRSLLPLLKGDTSAWRDKIFYEYYWEYDFPMTPTVFGVRTDKYKYIRYHGIWDTNELYDLENDPDETFNLISNPEYAEISRQLANDLFDWLGKTGGLQIPLKRTVKHPFGDYRHQEQY